MDPREVSYMKLFAADFLSLTVKQFSSGTPSFYRNGRQVLKVEILGVVVSCERKDRFLKFTMDDGSGCNTCILWLNQLQSQYFAQLNPLDLQLIANAATDHSSNVQLGALLRVRGKVTFYRGTLQITVTDVLVERDPNMEMLHWLECIRLAQKCYNNDH